MAQWLQAMEDRRMRDREAEAMHAEDKTAFWMRMFPPTNAAALLVKPMSEAVLTVATDDQQQQQQQQQQLLQQQRQQRVDIFLKPDSTVQMSSARLVVACERPLTPDLSKSSLSF